MPPIIVVAAVVAAAFALIFGVMSALQGARGDQRRRLETRLKTLAGTGQLDLSGYDFIRKTTLSEVPWFHRMLSSFTLTAKIDLLRKQANVQTPLGVFILLSLVLAIAGYQLAALSMPLPMLRPVMGLVFAAMPLVWLRRRKQARMKKFQAQLPDGLDLVARALKAGHAFTGGLRMIADEFGEPIGPEFAKTLDEINFGMSVSQALANLCQRIESIDLRFFVVAVNIQRETGGNLAEIVTTIAQLIRERFKLDGKVRVLSAEGRISAVILTLLPFAIGTVMYLLNPQYMSRLFFEPMGQMIMAAALVLIGIGTVIIRRMIRIEV
jgi:tight adherence protein B